jgi:hypothetical protein
VSRAVLSVSLDGAKRVEHPDLDNGDGQDGDDLAITGELLGIG